VTDPVESDKVLAPARVLERALELTRAELELVLVRGQATLIRVGTLLAVTLGAAAGAQIALMLMVLYPVLSSLHPGPALIVATLPVLVVAILLVVYAIRGWQRLLRGTAESTPPPTRTEPRRTEPLRTVDTLTGGKS
jgi:hypothetical protein